MLDYYSSMPPNQNKYSNTTAPARTRYQPHTHPHKNRAATSFSTWTFVPAPVPANRLPSPIHAPPSPSVFPVLHNRPAPGRIAPHAAAHQNVHSNNAHGAHLTRPSRCRLPQRAPRVHPRTSPGQQSRAARGLSAKAGYVPACTRKSSE